MRFDFRHGRDLIRLFSGPARKPVMAGDRAAAPRAKGAVIRRCACSMR
jgi:hypothetical protein